MSEEKKVPDNVLTIHLDLDSWLYDDSVIDRLEKKIVEYVATRFDSKIREKIESQVTKAIEDKFEEGIDKLVEQRLNSPVVKKNFDGEVIEETPILEYLSDRFTKHLSGTSMYNRSRDQPLLEQWMRDKSIQGLEKMIEQTLKSLKEEAEGAIRVKVKELLGDYIAKHWQPTPLPPLLREDGDKL